MNSPDETSSGRRSANAIESDFSRLLSCLGSIPSNKGHFMHFEGQIPLPKITHGVFMVKIPL